ILWIGHTCSPHY
ncbi:hypothetical protein CP8484711_1336B, partial [Chlamydia psittaci 84-8471/1]